MVSHLMVENYLADRHLANMQAELENNYWPYDMVIAFSPQKTYRVDKHSSLFILMISEDEIIL